MKMLAYMCVVFLIVMMAVIWPDTRATTTPATSSVPTTPSRDYLAEHGESFTYVLRAHRLNCVKMVSVEPNMWGWNVRCSGGERYKMTNESYIDSDGGVERERYRWKIRVID